jgi:alkylation response protein AidB-like acyl-CoA dehydrogenase
MAQVAKHELFGESIPMGDPAWYQGFNTGFYGPSHVAWRKQIRLFVEEVVEPIVSDWDTAAVQGALEECKEYIRTVYDESGKRGILPATVGKPWPQEYTVVKEPEGYDYFHELINIDETSRPGGGIAWAISGGLGIGLPPVLNFGIPGNRALQHRCATECLSGEKIICLGITEGTAGSDVSNLSTIAEDKGDHFLVNGSKMWITNGIYADYFTVAVRTGPPGSAHKGISMLLIERSMPGITTQKMECMGVWPSGTTYITFQNVKVPKENIIGKLNDGFKQIMFNFNHERWMLAIQAARLARTCLEESLRYARLRKTFGKFLIEHQVIQHKIGEMGRMCEATQAWVESITFQMNTMSKEEQNARLGGHIALLKVQSSKAAEFCARESLQVFGGAGYTRAGAGEKVERIYREVRAYAIPGGSEEIMLNLASSQMKFVNKVSPDPRDALIKKLQKENADLKSGQAKL